MSESNGLTCALLMPSLCSRHTGGPGAAHEAEQFAWNDAIVVPVMSTGGAANGLFNVPDKIFQVEFYCADAWSF